MALMVGTLLRLGIQLPLAVVGHAGSTVLVSMDGLRLLGSRGQERCGGVNRDGPPVHDGTQR